MGFVRIPIGRNKSDSHQPGNFALRVTQNVTDFTDFTMLYGMSAYVGGGGEDI